MATTAARDHSARAEPLTRLQDGLGLAGFVVACYAAGGIGSFLMGDFQPWYETLAKPSWTPSGAIIGGVWGVLYLLIGVSGWLVWRTAGWRNATVPLAVFAAQLAFNTAWSGIFFGLHELELAFYELAFMWLLIAWTIALFFRVHRGAGLLLAPYLAWVTFAGYLNWTLWHLN